MSATQQDLAELLKAVKSGLKVPIVGVGARWTTLYSQRGRNGIARSRTWLVSFPRFSRKRRNQLKTADRHAKKELKKQVRGVRTIERSVTNPDDAITEVNGTEIKG